MSRSHAIGLLPASLSPNSNQSREGYGDLSHHDHRAGDAAYDLGRRHPNRPRRKSPDHRQIPLKPQDAQSGERHGEGLLNNGTPTRWLSPARSQVGRLDHYRGCSGFHPDDLVGHVIEQGGWTHLNLPAIAEDRKSNIFPRRSAVATPARVWRPLDPERESQAALERIESLYGFNGGLLHSISRPRSDRAAI